ncbi:glycosyltransferase family 4 protein [Citrifermentans bremense]|uniref:glycosyltransferase family 4 protein n=1 Tax=Citrifermentans bremense TaxID=60035 RepID=UPI00040DB5AC|nr:glycosyltransferase family 4 protein [Citrifermentans bremense]
MKVLYLVFEALLGGHVMSAYTISRRMSGMGYGCVFAGGRGAMTDEIEKLMPFEEVHIPLYHHGRQSYFTWESFQAIGRIREIIKKHDIDLIHAFDSRSYVHAYLAALFEGKPILCTLCGGQDPYYNLPVTSSMVVFSQEQKMKLVQKYRWSGNRVVINMARMDLDELYDPGNAMPDEEWAALGLSLRHPVVVTISSFDSSKDKMIRQLRQAIEGVVASGVDCQFALVGGGKGDLYQETVAWAAALNQSSEYPRVVLTGPQKRAFRLLKRAKVVIGSGRSAFEGMCYGVPTMIVGEYGYAGDVCAADIEGIAYYNFSGRNLSAERPAERIGERLVELLSDPGQCREVGEFGRQYLLDNLDVVQGCRRYSALYQEALGDTLGKARKLGSFAKCQAPIWLDNFAHDIRQFLKK